MPTECSSLYIDSFQIPKKKWFEMVQCSSVRIPLTYMKGELDSLCDFSFSELMNFTIQ